MRPAARTEEAQGKGLYLHICRSSAEHRSAGRQRVIRPTGNAERALPDVRRRLAGAPKGNSNALKHGRYTAEAIAPRRDVAALIRGMRETADGVR